MLAHPQVRSLIASVSPPLVGVRSVSPPLVGVRAASTWGEHPFKRHNDASHPIYALSTLPDRQCVCTEGTLAHP